MSCTCGWENCTCDNNSYTKAALNGYGTLTKSDVDRLMKIPIMKGIIKRKIEKQRKEKEQGGYALSKSEVDSLLDPTWLRDLTIKRRKLKVGKGKTMNGRGVAIPKDLQGIMNTKFVRDLIEKKRKVFEEEIRKRKKKTFF